MSDSFVISTSTALSIKVYLALYPFLSAPAHPNNYIWSDKAVSGGNTT